MLIYINIIKNCLKNRKNLTLCCVITFILGVVLGVLVSFSEDFSCFYKEFLLNYFGRILSLESFGVSYLLKKVISFLILLVVIFLLSFNKYTFYLIFLILFYRAYIIGLAFKLFISQLNLNGMFFFLFLVLLNGLFVSLAITIFICLNYCKTSVNDFDYKIRMFLFSASIAVVGAIFEFLFIVAIFRPFNFYF